jgi:Preprotein translocase subunit SecA (ATPase, RNA helicase)
MEDDLMRLFGGEMISGLMERLGWTEDMPIEHSAIAKRIENAQRKVESRNFEIRKNVLDYDDVLNKQREIIYELRRKLLFGEDVHEKVLEMFAEVVGQLLDVYAQEKVAPEEWDLEGLLHALYANLMPPQTLTIEDLSGLNRSELQELILNTALETYEAKEAEISTEYMREIERRVMLQAIDINWMGHLEAMDELKEGIGLRAYAQNDPLVAYKIEAYQMFKEMRDNINEEVIRVLSKFQLVSEERVVKKPKIRNIATNLNEDGTSAVQQRTVGKKVGRNDPCPCGSGKKYKKCCGQAAG